MAIAVSREVRSTPNTTNYSVAYDCGTGDGRILVLVIQYVYSPTNVKYNGVSLTLSNEFSAGKTQLYYLELGATTGSNNLTMTFVNGDANEALYYFTLTGCATSSAIGTKGKVSPEDGTTSPVSLSLSSKNNSMVIAVGQHIYGGSGQLMTWDSGITTLSGVDQSGGTYYAVCAKRPLTADNQGVGFTCSGGIAVRNLMAQEFLAPAVGPTNLKTVNGLAKASIKTIDNLAIGSIKSYNNLT